MKKTFLLCILTLIGIASMHAEMVNMTITVDNARNVKLNYSNGNGEAITLQTGENKLLLDNTLQPILVQSVYPATLERVTVNGNPVGIQGEQMARVGIVQGNEVVITTTGAAETTGVTINVANPDWVIVKQSAGFGEALQLQAGDTSFPVDDIKGPLQISAAEGCRIISVVKDGETLTPNASDIYSVSDLVEGTTIDINAQEIPAAVPVTLSVPENWEHLTVSNGTEPYEVEWNNGMATIMVTPGDLLYFDVKREDYKTYYISSFLNTGGSYTVNNEGIYTTPVNSSCSIMATVSPFMAADGKWVVTFDVNSPLIALYHLVDGERVNLNPDRAHLIANETSVVVSTFSSFTIEKALLNGVDMYPDDDVPNYFNVPITENSNIEIEGYVYVDVWCDRTTNDAFVEIGQIFVVDPKTGEQVTSCKVKPGTTLSLIGVSVKGYVYRYSYLLTDPDVTFTDEVTVPEDWEKEFYSLKGVFEEDNRKMYTVVGNTAYNIETKELTGHVLISYDGKTQDTLPVPEGDTVTLVAQPEPGYKLVHFMMFYDNDRIIDGNTYTVNADDANQMGVIDITALFTYDDGGVSTITADSFNYDGSNITAPGIISLYNLNGQCVAKGNDQLDISTLPAGVYIAVVNGKNFKVIH